MTKFESLPEWAHGRDRPVAAKSEFARYADEACETLARMVAQELSIRDSLRDSRKAIEESQILLNRLGPGPV